MLFSEKPALIIQSKPGSKEILEGCSECGSHFFFYIRDDQMKAIHDKVIEIPEEEKKQVEEDIREIVGIPDEQTPVILDIESIVVSDQGMDMVVSAYCKFGT